MWRALKLRHMGSLGHMAHGQSRTQACDDPHFTTVYVSESQGACYTAARRTALSSARTAELAQMAAPTGGALVLRSAPMMVPCTFASTRYARSAFARVQGSRQCRP